MITEAGEARKNDRVGFVRVLLDTERENRRIVEERDEEIIWAQAEAVELVMVLDKEREKRHDVLSFYSSQENGSARSLLRVAQNTERKVQVAHCAERVVINQGKAVTTSLEEKAAASTKAVEAFKVGSIEKHNSAPPVYAYKYHQDASHDNVVALPKPKIQTSLEEKPSVSTNAVDDFKVGTVENHNIVPPIYAY